MLIGVDQESNTSIHSCEEIAEVPYHLQEEITEAYVIGYKGERIVIRNRLHNWNKPPTDFNKLDWIFYEKGIMRIGKIGNSIIRLIEADKMFEITVELLRRQPYFLVKNSG
ncbi:AAC(3) family N-acetyltransferase [Caldanaerobacter subterraneus KAk]|uniref:AAC(3) family N-acetyltransferase n=1 Tax=Caldanaerobacter subterraneus TaxID=911092 RepID=UPI0032BF7D0D